MLITLRTQTSQWSMLLVALGMYFLTCKTGKIWGKMDEAKYMAIWEENLFLSAIYLRLPTRQQPHACCQSYTGVVQNQEADCGRIAKSNPRPQLVVRQWCWCSSPVVSSQSDRAWAICQTNVQNLSGYRCAKLIKTYHRILAAVTAAKGYFTKYWFQGVNTYEPSKFFFLLFSLINICLTFACVSFKC